jgi:hypothetical protein
MTVLNGSGEHQRYDIFKFTHTFKEDKEGKEPKPPRKRATKSESLTSAPSSSVEDSHSLAGAFAVSSEESPALKAEDMGVIPTPVATEGGDYDEF